MEYEETFLAWQRCAQHLFPSCAFRRKGVSRHLTSSTSSVLQAPHTASTVVIAPATKAYHRFIFRRYTEPHRYYHTMHHLELMLRDLKDYREVCSFAPANRDDSDGEYPAWVSDLILDLAILFHDAVYVPGNVNNETRSVHLFRKFLQSARKFNCPPDAGANPEEASAYAIKSKRREWLWADPAMAKFVEEKVCELIMATKTHMETKPPTVFPMAKAATKHRGEEDDIKHLFLDLDLAVLGLPPTKYKRQYAVAIRREYSALSDVAFCEGRLKFLSGFLKEEQWFRTRYFFDRYEKQARCNVREEMIELEDKKRQLGQKPQAKL